MYPVGFAAKYTEVPFRRQVSFHCPFIIQKAIGGTRAVQQSTSTNSYAVTQAGLNIFKDHQIETAKRFFFWCGHSWATLKPGIRNPESGIRNPESGIRNPEKIQSSKDKCVLRDRQSRHLTLTVPLYTQVYKWVPANLMLGVTLRWTSIPSREE